jgi:hypothetical protein
MYLCQVDWMPSIAADHSYRLQKAPHGAFLRYEQTAISARYSNFGLSNFEINSQPCTLDRNYPKHPHGQKP